MDFITIIPLSSLKVSIQSSVICLIYTSKALGLQAQELRAYISGKSQVPMYATLPSGELKTAQGLKPEDSELKTPLYL